VSYAAAIGRWVLPSPDEMLHSGGGAAWVAAVHAGRCGDPLSREPVTRNAWPHQRPMASASNWSRAGWRFRRCVRGLIKASRRCPRRNFGEEPRYLVISRNGVFEAAHALGVKPGIFGSASMLLRIYSARRTHRMQTRPDYLWSGR